MLESSAVVIVIDKRTNRVPKRLRIELLDSDRIDVLEASSSGTSSERTPLLSSNSCTISSASNASSAMSTQQVTILGIAFLLIFSAFNTLSISEKVIVDHINDTSHLNWNAFYSLCIIYAVFSLSNWIAPSFVAITGTKYAMFFSSLTYVIFIGQFLMPTRYGIYVSACLLGIGAAILWCASGAHLSSFSYSGRADFNSSLFWSLFQSSLLLGNGFIYFQFGHSTDIQFTLKCFMAVAMLGSMLLLTLKTTSPEDDHNRSEDVSDADADNDTNCHLKRNYPNDKYSASHALKTAFRLVFTFRILLFSLSFLYSGMILSFYSGVYGAAVGYSTSIAANSKQLIGLIGFLIGIGEILGSSLLGILFSCCRDPLLPDSKQHSHGHRIVIVTLSVLIHIVALVLIALNLAPESVNHDTQNVGMLGGNIIIALGCALLLGLGDAALNTQLYAMLSVIYPQQPESSGAFALYKFFQSVGASVAFAYAQSLSLWVQCAILVGIGGMSLITFIALMRLVIRENASGGNTL